MNHGPQLLEFLRRNGVASGNDLTRLLNISSATLSRLVRTYSGQVARLGRTRGARYGLLNPATSIGAEIPFWAIGADGAPQLRGEIYLLHGPAYWVDTTTGATLYDGVPPFINDMAPQGYMGRAFPAQHIDLGLPDRIQDWSDEHVLRAVAMRGEDAPGNLVVGAESMDRFLSSTPVITQESEYPAITRDLARQIAGSSAAGEYPKFSAFDGERHLIVKFTAGDDSPGDRRWIDLLACEAIASEVLRDSGIAATRSEILDVGNQRFLTLERFDRTGTRGRVATMSLAAIDDHRHGKRDNWAAAAHRLHRDGLLSNEDLDRMLLLEAFGQLIGNSDRHFGNITFYWDGGESFHLAPVYDMLPMMFAPATGGMVVDREFQRPTPTSALLGVWQNARDLAGTFWSAVERDERISAGFRRHAAAARRTVLL